MAAYSSKHKWMWGEVEKSDIEPAMEGATTGSFFIKQSTNKSSYTLCLRYNGITKYLKIHTKDGKFDFNTNYRFQTLSKLVRYYEIFSLEECFSTIKTPLTQALSRETNQLDVLMNVFEHQNAYGRSAFKDCSQFDDTTLCDILEECLVKLNQLQLQIDSSVQLLQICSQQLNDLHIQCKTLLRLNLWCQNHVGLIIQTLPNKNLSQSAEEKQQYHQSCTLPLELLNSQLHQQDQQLQDTGKEISIQTLRRDEEMAQLQSATSAQCNYQWIFNRILCQLKSRGLREEHIVILDYEYSKQMFQQLRIALFNNNFINNEQLWYLDIDKNESTKMLLHRLKETFLVRPSSTIHGYTIDIRISNGIRNFRVMLLNNCQCKLGNTENPLSTDIKYFLKFSNLVKLINYFHYNPIFVTCGESFKLKYPIQQSSTLITAL